MGCHRSCCYGPRAAIVAATVGAALCIGFALTMHYIPNILHSITLLILPMAPDGLIFPYWADPPIDLTINIFMFNYTNSDEYMNNWKNGVKLKVEQMGPYTYTAHLKKVFLDWSEPPYVSYRQIHTFHFHPELSNGTEDDWIIMPNSVTTVLITMIQSPKLGKLLSLFMDKFLAAEPPFIPVRVGDFIADGYYDETLDNIQHTAGVEIMPGARIGLFYGKNATDDGKYTMNTGSENTDLLYHVAAWEGQWSLADEWGDKYCGMFNGTDGTLYPVGVDKLDRVYIFLSFIQRSLYANFTNTMKHKGVDCYRYQVPLQYYADYNMNPDNWCYTNSNPKAAYASGVLYMGKIAHGAPLYMSNPHFYDGDFRLVENIEGLNPNREEHSTELGIIPEFGAPVLGNVRLQLNILLSPGQGINQTEDWPTIMLPIVWGNGSGSITDAMAVNVKKYYYGGMKGVFGVLIGLIVIFGLTALAGMTCAYKLMFQFKKGNHRRHKSKSLHLDTSEHSKFDEHD